MRSLRLLLALLGAVPATAAPVHAQNDTTYSASTLRLLQGDRTAAELWYTAAAQADSATWAAYRRDLHPLLDTELAQFDALPPGEARTRWLRAFFQQRDTRDMRGGGERLMEHYRRLRLARERYPLPTGRSRQYLPGANYRSGSTEFDDRGIIYIRHGAPNKIVRGGREGPSTDIANLPTYLGEGAAAVPLNETWRYIGSEGERVYTFRACATPGARSFRLASGICIPPLDYQLVESVLDIFGPQVAARIASGAGTIRSTDSLAGSAIETAILQRSGLSPRFGRLLVSDRYTLPTEAATERAAGKADVDYGTREDSHEPRWPRALDLRLEPFAAGREGDQGLVHLAWAIGAGSTSPTFQDGAWLYPIRVRVQVRDARDSIVAMREELRISRARSALGRRETLLGRLSVAVPPGAHTVRVAIEHDEETGATLAPLNVTVPSVIPGQLTGGDLVLGDGGVPLVWLRAPEDSVRLNPTGVFATDTPLELYHELYGLAEGEEYRWSLELSREKGGLVGKLTGGRTTKLTLGGRESATGPLTVVRRFLDLSTLEPGRYVLTTEIAAARGGKLKRTRTLEIESRR